MDELKEDGSVVLTGTDIKSAKSGSYQNSTTGANKNVVQLSMTKEGTEKFAEATKAIRGLKKVTALNLSRMKKTKITQRNFLFSKREWIKSDVQGYDDTGKSDHIRRGA